MYRKLRTHLNPASLLATVALFASLGGVSYAASTIGTSDIENGAVTTKKLKKNAVTTAKIKTDAVTGAKVKESTLGQVPNATEAAHATKADSAVKADSAGKADSAVNAEQLGGVPAAQFGSGIVGGTVTAPPVAALAPSFGEGAPFGSGDHFEMPVPVPLKVRNITVKAIGDLSRTFVVSVRNNGDQALACAGVVTCSAPGPVSFEPGDILELGVVVPPGPAIFGGATYQVGYQITP